MTAPARPGRRITFREMLLEPNYLARRERFWRPTTWPWRANDSYERTVERIAAYEALVASLRAIDADDREEGRAA